VSEDLKRRRLGGRRPRRGRRRMRERRIVPDQQCPARNTSKPHIRSKRVLEIKREERENKKTKNIGGRRRRYRNEGHTHICSAICSSGLCGCGTVLLKKSAPMVAR
jgi:hypothetical protein